HEAQEVLRFGAPVELEKRVPLAVEAQEGPERGILGKLDLLVEIERTFVIGGGDAVPSGPLERAQPDLRKTVEDAAVAAPRDARRSAAREGRGAAELRQGRVVREVGGLAVKVHRGVPGSLLA